jgi:hypothetical protein
MRFRRVAWIAITSETTASTPGHARRLRAMPTTATTGAIVELDRLAELEHEALARVDEVERAASAVGEELAAAQEALIEAERRRVTATDRRKLEQRLASARERHAEPWAERMQGARRAAVDARHAMQRHATEHLDELVAVLEADGRDAADGVDQAAHAFMRAVEHRAACESRLTSIVSMTRPSMRPGDIQRARSDEAALAVSRFLQQGGEAAPTLRVARPAA